MKRFIILLSMVAVLAGCNKDKQPKTPTANDLAGVWWLTEELNMTQGGVSTFADTTPQSLVFITDDNSLYRHTGSPGFFLYTWTLNGNKMHMVYSYSSDANYDCVIKSFDGKHMVLTEDWGSTGIFDCYYTNMYTLLIGTWEYQYAAKDLTVYTVQINKDGTSQWSAPSWAKPASYQWVLSVDNDTHYPVLSFDGDGWDEDLTLIELVSDNEIVWGSRRGAGMHVSMKRK